MQQKVTIANTGTVRHVFNSGEQVYKMYFSCWQCSFLTSCACIHQYCQQYMWLHAQSGYPFDFPELNDFHLVLGVKGLIHKEYVV